MKNYNKKAFLYLGIGLALLVFFCKSITVDSENFFFLLLILISPVAAIVLFVLSIINAVKWEKEKKKSARNSNVNTALQNQPVQPAPQLQNNNAVSYTPVQHTQVEKPAQNKKPIKFHTFNYEDKIIELYKVYENVSIKGTNYHNAPADLEYAENVDIKRDSNNEYDDRAIGIYVTRNDNDILLGYLSKDSGLYNMANDFIDRDEIILAKIDSVENMTIAIAFYKVKINLNSYDRLKNKKPIKTFSVTLNEEQACGCDVGEEVTFDYDFEYMSVSYGENKKLSAGVSEFLSNYNAPVIAYVTESEYNYDDKTKAKISVYEKR